MTKVSVSYANCSLFVVGLDMNCPLCKVLVKSGDHHACTKPEIEPSKIRKPKRRALAGKSGEVENER